jgi:hypothetical protein
MNEKDSRYEHLVVGEGGNLKGLYTIDAKNVTGVAGHGYWDKIEHLIEQYVKLHPLEMQEAIEHNKMQKSSSINEFGSDKNKYMRRTIGIPNGLLIAIMTFDPEFLENGGNKLLKFCKRFPGLSAVTRV